MSTFSFHTNLVQYESKPAPALTLNNLYYHYQALMRLADEPNSFTKEEILAIEKQKLWVIINIKHRLHLADIIDQEQTIINDSPSKRFFGYTYAFIGPFIASIGGFLGFRAILSLIMHVPNLAAIVIAVITAAFEGFLSFCREENDIKKLIGAPIIKPKPIINTYQEQLTAVQDINNNILTHANCARFTKQEYQAYQQIIGLFHDDIISKRQKLDEAYKETTAKRLLKYFIGGIDAVLYIGSGYLMGKCLLGLFAAPLVATPLGIGICAGIALFSVVTFYFIKRHQIADVIDNIIGNPKHLKAEQEKFITQPNGMKKFNREIKAIIDNKSKQFIANTDAVKIKKSSLKKSIKLNQNRFFKQTISNDPKQEINLTNSSLRSVCKVK